MVPANLFVRKRKAKGLITLPAHKTCNGGFSLDDEHFRLCVTAMSVPHDEAAKTVWDGPTMRGLHRPEMPGLKTDILNSLHPVEVHTEGGLYLGTTEALLREPGRILRVINRITRGLYARRTGNVLAADFPVSSDWIDPDAAVPVFKLLNITLRSVGEGEFRYGWANMQDDEQEGLCWMIFYNTVHYWGYTGSKLRDMWQPPNTPTVLPSGHA